MTAEDTRLEEARNRSKHWKRWGPYLSERAWGTVREDYSPDGRAWDYFPHDQARSRAYRWNEDGLGGISDRQQFLCLAIALWNERDPILKERLFGLNGLEGNHGEDCKEVYYFLDNTPTHSFMRFRYVYPTRAFPYADLVAANARRGKNEPEYELVDSGAFDDGYFDVELTYAKASPEDLLLRIEVANVSPAAARLRVLPTLWFRNTWSWRPRARKPRLSLAGPTEVLAEHGVVGRRWCAFSGTPELLFCDNESNLERLFKVPGNPSPKDAIDDAIVGGRRDRLLAEEGTKVAAHYAFELAPGARETVWVRLADRQLELPFEDALAVLDQRRVEANEFYAALAPSNAPADALRIQRQAYAGLLWSKQFYHYNVELWLRGDPAQPPPPGSRWEGRNHDWQHLNNADVISMPDTWEYPWFAAWDLAFHCIPLAQLDPDFAKEQLILMLREWYMHPNGQIPAYEWAFGDVNPPVHAWAAWRVYKIEQKQNGGIGDLNFLERVFHKLLLNFTWWVNRKDSEGNNVFQGGFLG